MFPLLLVDNNAQFLEAFARLLEVPPDMEVVAQAGSPAEARGKLSGLMWLLSIVGCPTETE